MIVKYVSLKSVHFAIVSTREKKCNNDIKESCVYKMKKCTQNKVRVHINGGNNHSKGYYPVSSTSRRYMDTRPSPMVNKYAVLSSREVDDTNYE